MKQPKHLNKYANKNKLMIFSNTNSLSTFISEIINLKPSEKVRKLETEKMSIASKEYAYNSNTITDVSKLLFIQLCGVTVNELEFIRACGSKDIDIKTAGYLGVLFYKTPQKGLLLLNTIWQDLQNSVFSSLMLSFIANINSNVAFSDLLFKINEMTEESPEYKQYIIAKSRCSKKLLFSMYSQNNDVLFVKLQIIVDKKYHDQLTSNDLMCLNEQIYFTKSKHTILKLIECYRILVTKGLMRISEKLFEFLKNLILSPSKLEDDYLELALSLETCKLLIEVGYFSEKAEYFIFQLINSKNANLKYLGCKFAMEYNIFSNLVVDRLSKCGTNMMLNLDILLKIIDESNYKNIYKQKEEIIHQMIKQEHNIKNIEDITKKILVEIANKAEPDFLWMMLVENPTIYKDLRHEIFVKKHNVRALFGRIVEINNFDYFLMIYDMFSVNSYSEDFITAMAMKHITVILEKHPGEESACLLDGLIDVLLTNGNREKNRELVIKWYCTAIEKKLSSVIIDRIRSGVLLFNLVMNEKIMELFNGLYIRYIVERNKILLNYSNPVEKVLLYDSKKEIISLEDMFISNNLINVSFSIKDFSKIMLKAFIQDKVVIKSLILSNNQ